MGAGQIGGIATLLDIDFDNAAGFVGVKTEVTEAQFVIYYLSHAMMFCAGALIEAHVALTPASCVIGERYKFSVFAGTHKFRARSGIFRIVQHVCIHRGYNHTERLEYCTANNNIALLVLDRQLSFHKWEPGADFILNRLRYGFTTPTEDNRIGDTSCRYYGWGSRRNGYLIPLLIHLRRVDVTILPQEKCLPMWNFNNSYLCIDQPSCKSEKFGALCPDDLGSVLVCSGYAQGMMISRLIDRPCGVGFLDLAKFNKFLTCGVDDSRDVIDHDPFMTMEFTTPNPVPLLTVPTRMSSQPSVVPESTDQSFL